MDRDWHFHTLSHQVILNSVLNLSETHTNVEHDLLRHTEVVICNIVNILVVSDPVPHFLHLEAAVISHRLALRHHVLIHLLQSFWGFVCTSIDLLDHRICEVLHLFLGLHHVLQVDSLRLISHNQKLFIAATNPHTHLPQLDVTSGFASGVGLRLDRWLNFENTSWFITLNEIPNRDFPLDNRCLPFGFFIGRVTDVRFNFAGL